jgi:YHS domain-containing protein
MLQRRKEYLFCSQEEVEDFDEVENDDELELD